MSGLLVLAGCASRTPSPVTMADRVTRAIYNDDVAGAVADFDAATKAQMTRAQIGALSDKMHALGDLKSVAPRAGADPDKGRYDYDAMFSRGSMLVELRVDPSGRIGAYRIVPQEVPPAAAPSPGK